MGTTKRKVRDEADAWACIGAVERSGRTLKAWANANGVDGRSLQAWQVNLRRRSTALRLVELVAETEKPLARYVVRVGGVEVEVDDQFDDCTLGRLLAVVAAC